MGVVRYDSPETWVPRVHYLNHYAQIGYGDIAKVLSKCDGCRWAADGTRHSIYLEHQQHLERVIDQVNMKQPVEFVDFTP